LFPFGITIHHDGMSREDQSLMEEVFMDEFVQVLMYCDASICQPDSGQAPFYLCRMRIKRLDVRSMIHCKALSSPRGSGT
ncbi:hypothetical protein EDD85DRAFT_782551, partial [Armillaria nabsnona]